MSEWESYYKTEGDEEEEEEQSPDPGGKWPVWRKGFRCLIFLPGVFYCLIALFSPDNLK